MARQVRPEGDRSQSTSTQPQSGNRYIAVKTIGKNNQGKDQVIFDTQSNRSWKQCL
jgi:hypothetical protein